MYASVLSLGTRLERALKGKKGYVHVIQTLIQTSGYNDGKATGAMRISSQDTTQLTLKEADGAYASVGQTGNEVQNDSGRVAEVVVFDLE